jgi:hypothetical protein
MLNVQTIITDALIKSRAMSPQDAGNPDPELQAIAVRELNMLLLDIGISGTYNVSRRTYVVNPQSRDRLTFGDVSQSILSATYQYTVPTTSPFTVQLDSTNLQDVVITFVDTDTVASLTTNIAPTSIGTVQVDYSTGLLTFFSGDASKLVTVAYHWRPSTSTHADIAEQPNNIISLSYELGNIVYPLTRLSYSEYQALSLKQQVSTIPQFFAFDFQFPNPTCWIWPMATSGTTARVVLSRAYLSATDGSELDVPDYMYKYLVYNLTTQIYTSYPVPGGLDSEIMYHARESAGNLRSYMARQNMQKARGNYHRASSNRSIFTDLGSPLGGYSGSR